MGLKSAIQEALNSQPAVKLANIDTSGAVISNLVLNEEIVAELKNKIQSQIGNIQIDISIPKIESVADILKNDIIEQFNNFKNIDNGALDVIKNWEVYISRLADKITALYSGIKSVISVTTASPKAVPASTPSATSKPQAAEDNKQVRQANSKTEQAQIQTSEAAKQTAEAKQQTEQAKAKTAEAQKQTQEAQKQSAAESKQNKSDNQKYSETTLKELNKLFASGDRANLSDNFTQQLKTKQSEIETLVKQIGTEQNAYTQENIDKIAAMKKAYADMLAVFIKASPDSNSAFGFDPTKMNAELDKLSGKLQFKHITSLNGKIAQLKQEILDLIPSISKAGSMSEQDLKDLQIKILGITTQFTNLRDTARESLSNDTWLDIETATNDLVSTMKAFNITAEDSIKIVDTFDTLGNKFALTSADVGSGLKTSASALAAANNTMEQSAAMITAITEITQDSSNAGNALKVLAMRLRGASAELQEEGEDVEGLCDSTSKLRDKLQSLAGVDIMLDENTFKSTYQIMSEIAHAWNNISDVNQAALLETIAGKTRANQVAALLNNWSQAEKALENSLNSAGTAAKENEVYLDSIEGKIAQLKATAQGLSNDIINSSWIKGFIDTINTILTGLDSVTEGLEKFSENFDKKTNVSKYFDTWKSVPSILTAVTAALTAMKKEVGMKMPFTPVTEFMHKPENCWEALMPVYQSAA